MTDYVLRLGKGPDFVMTSGDVVFFHRAELRLVRENRKSERVNQSHPCLVMLLRRMHGTLIAISGFQEVKIEWIVCPILAGNFPLPLGSGTLNFKFPIRISHSQRIQLMDEIQDFFNGFNGLILCTRCYALN